MVSDSVELCNTQCHTFVYITSCRKYIGVISVVHVLPHTKPELQYKLYALQLDASVVHAVLMKCVGTYIVPAESYGHFSMP